jgi:hypothetical protein
MRTWFKRWRGTTLCHGGWLAPNMTGTLIEDHEQVHVEQYETAGLIFGTYTFMWCCFEPELWFWGLASWAVMPFLFMLSGFAIAWLRGEDPYRGSVNEEAAYAITNGVFVYNGVSYTLPEAGICGNIHDVGVTAYNPVLAETKLFPLGEKLPEGWISVFKVTKIDQKEKSND